MFTILTSALDWLLLSWFIWPILCALVLLPHAAFNGTYRNGDFQTWPMLPIGLLVGAAYWRWSALLPHSWVGWALLGAAYLVAGFVYSLGKYVGALKALRVQALKLTPEERRTDTAIRQAFPYGSGVLVAQGKITLDWTRLPLANWWIYWPWFACSSVLDVVTNFGRHLVALFKGLYSRLAERFAVKL